MVNLALLLCLLAAGGTGQQVPGGGGPAQSRTESKVRGAPEQPKEDPVSEFVREALPGLSGLTIEQGRSLAKVVREEVKTYPSDWVAGESVEMHTVVLDGLELAFAVHSGRPSFLVSATFSKSSWKLLHGLGVGAPQARVLKVLGGEAKGDYGMFMNAEGAPNAAEFFFASGVVVKVKLTPYTG
jgi:hypothetical protein